MLNDAKLVAYQASHLEGYLEFARSAFGVSAYQSDPDYLQWLYTDSPLTEGSERDCTLAQTSSGEVVGCIHKMRMCWRWRGQLITAPSLHNAMVAETHRHGIGAGLIVGAYQKESHLVVPGAEGPLADGYRRLKFLTTATEWRVRWLRPFDAVRTQLLQRMFVHWRSPAAPWPISSLGQSSSAVTRVIGSQPQQLSDVSALVNFANRLWDDEGEFVQHWTDELFFWRFFHPHGPRHLLLTLAAGERIVGYGIFSIGLRRGLNIARMVECRVSSADGLKMLLEKGSALARSAGAHLMLVFTGDGRHNTWLRQSGWRSWRRAPQTMVYHKREMVPAATHRFMPSVGDYGFEAFSSAA